MWLRQFDADHGIAEGVDFIDEPVTFRRHLDDAVQALLERRGPWHQVQQVMRVHHVRRVLVKRLVPDAVFAAGAHVASAWASDSMSAK